MDHQQLLPNLHGNISSSPGSVSEALLSRTGFTILAVIIGVFSVSGVCMNVLVIMVTMRHRKLRQPLNYALVNLAVADLGCALFGGLPTMVTNAMGYFSMGRLGCVLEGFAVAFFGIAGLCSVAVIAVDRYVVVCRPMGAVMFQTRHAVGGVVLSWVWSFLWNTPPLFGWGSFELEGVRTSCSPNWYSREPGNMSYIILYFLLCFAIPFSIIMVSYARILFTLHQVVCVWHLLGPGYPAPALRAVCPVRLHSPVRPVPAPRTCRAKVVFCPGRFVPPLCSRPPVRLHSPVYLVLFLLCCVSVSLQFRDCAVPFLLCGLNPWASEPVGSEADTALSSVSKNPRVSPQ
ncbi:unnamed protein product [Oncorhynchus mykiss]|uniref:G-protein coupled receptors family 1 profile domain-containing protein n=1 Tax=Oncorhynchus mykiss TaxID=8022 RepID=A0A060YBY6_ONCMY|nr:unnamed protein product [Oncorhynchus mykiss]